MNTRIADSRKKVLKIKPNIVDSVATILDSVENTEEISSTTIVFAQPTSGDVAKDYTVAMRKFPTGVTVVTTDFQNKLYGLTINSFTSVSLLPPLISFCLNKESGSYNAFKMSNRFAISILAEDQEHIAKHFAISNNDKFKDISYKLSVNNYCPLINEAICWIECVKNSEYDIGDHILLICEVKNYVINNNKQPLIYYSRNYTQLKK